MISEVIKENIKFDYIKMVTFCLPKKVQMNKFSGKLVGKLSSMCDRQRANFLDKECSQIDKQKHQYLKRKIIKNVSRHFTESTGDSILYKKMLKLNCKKKKYT